jgi:hypothetical protein
MIFLNIIKDFFIYFFDYLKKISVFLIFIIPKPFRIILMLFSLFKEIIDSLINKLFWR